ncbi:MAG: hypothetical protein KGM98_13515, partial [Bacteroidota bacterium]|nr:hypothetical protein [Bacteroidota bacterium]
MKTRNVLLTILVSTLTTLAVILGYNIYQQHQDNPNFATAGVPSNYKYAGFFDNKGNPTGGPV